MTRPLRLAFARINQETNALSPVHTTLDDFRATHLHDGDGLLALCAPDAQEVKDMFKNAELSGFVQEARKLSSSSSPIELVPLLSAWAVPGGPLTRACFDALVNDLVERLRNAGAVDAVYLSLHGAMNVECLELSSAATPESEIVRRVREVVGDDMPVAVSLDLHGLIVRDLVERATFLQGYRTNPHRDHRDIGRRCARVLVRTLRGEIAPRMAWRSLPMLLGGGNTIDFLNPLRAIFRAMTRMEHDDRVLGASLMTVHPWNRHPELGWAIVVVTDAKSDASGALAEAHADALARMAWDVRHQLPPVFSSADDAIARARASTWARRLGVVVLSDASDVVSAGAPGESTLLMSKLLQAQDLTSYLGHRDPQLVDELWRTNKPGDRVHVTLGRKLDAAHGETVQVDAEIVSMPRNHGVERTVVLRAGKTFIVVVEGPALVVQPGFFSRAGLSLLKADVVVVKNFFPFLLFFLPFMRKVVFVTTRGTTDFDAAFALPFAGPMHPRDRVDDWREADARRRRHDDRSVDAHVLPKAAA